MKYTLASIFIIICLQFLTLSTVKKGFDSQEYYQNQYYAIRKSHLDSSVAIIGRRVKEIKHAVDSEKIPDNDKNKYIIQVYELMAKKMLLEEIKQKHESR